MTADLDRQNEPCPRTPAQGSVHRREPVSANRRHTCRDDGRDPPLPDSAVDVGERCGSGKAPKTAQGIEPMGSKDVTGFVASPAVPAPWTRRVSSLT